MSVKLVEEVHDGVGVQSGGANDHVFLVGRPVRGVGSAQLFPLHPRVSQLLKLSTAPGQCQSQFCGLGWVRSPGGAYGGWLAAGDDR